MRPSLKTLLALALLAAAPPARAADVPAPAAGGEGPLGPWLQARAREHEAHARAGSGAAGRGAEALWRERPGGQEGLAGFVPPTSLAPLVRAVEAGVVNITALGAPGPSGTPGRSSGSGFVLGPQGHVVTNNHVVARARSILVRLADGREFAADVVGRDASTDVALLKLQGAAAAESLPAVYLGDSDKLEVGDWVVAIGNPFGLDHSVAHGLISAKERVLGVGIFDDFIQTDALINPGNSGGPLFNMRGEVVGVTTAIISQGQGIGFAVPINMVKDLLPNLAENGRLARGWLGVNIDEHPGEGGAPERSAVVKSVYPGSPARQAGLQAGDRILAVNGRAIDSYLQLLRRVALLAPGTEARLTLARGGVTREVTVKLAERPARETQEALGGPGNLDVLGLVVGDLTPEVAAQLGLQPYAGVLVAGVVPGSPAANAQLRAGDVITELNRRRVKDVAGVRAALERGRSADGTVLLKVERGEVSQYAALKP